MSYRFDPELEPLLAGVPRRDVTDPVGIRRDLETEWRAQADDGRAVASTDVEVREEFLAGPTGDQLRLRIHQPLPDNGSRGVVLHLHSGGFYSGTLETERWQALLVAAGAGVPVVSVEYRLAPEHPFPAGLLDCWAALREVAARWSGAPLVVLGSSAGGALAAALCHLARSSDGPRIALQCLVCPVLDDRLEGESARSFVDTPSWDGPSCDLMWGHYLPGGHGAARRTGDGPGEVPVLAAPGRATDLRGLPPAFVAVAEYDPLRDEGLAYAAALARSGVAVELRSYPGVVHGFESIAPDSRVAADARRHLVAAVRAAVLRTAG